MIAFYDRTDDQNGVIVDAVWSTPESYVATGNNNLVADYQLLDYHVFDLGLGNNHPYPVISGWG